MEANKELETTIAKGVVKASVWLFLANIAFALVLGIILSVSSKKQSNDTK